jgi:hypothetical protein
VQFLKAFDLALVDFSKGPEAENYLTHPSPWGKLSDREATASAINRRPKSPVPAPRDLRAARGPAVEEEEVAAEEEVAVAVEEEAADDQVRNKKKKGAPATGAVPPAAKRGRPHKACHVEPASEPAKGGSKQILKLIQDKNGLENKVAAQAHEITELKAKHKAMESQVTCTHTHTRTLLSLSSVSHITTIQFSCFWKAQSCSGGEKGRAGDARGCE